VAIEKKNIFLSDTMKHYDYKAQGKPGPGPRIPQRNPVQHAETLKKELFAAYKKHDDLTPKQIAAIKYKDGICLEFSGQQAHELMLKSLENMSTGIRLQNVRVDAKNDIVCATVFIPNGKKSFFVNRIDKYAETANIGKPRYQNFINSIEKVKLAVVESFWTGKTEDMPKEVPLWCEVWIQTDKDEEKIDTVFSDMCANLQIPISNKSIQFPERIVKLIRANKKQLAEIIKRFAHIAEFRRMEEPTSFFEDLNGDEQKKWIDDLLQHTVYNLTDTSTLYPPISSGCSFA